MSLLFLNILFVIVNAKYSWSIDRINQKTIIPDFQIFNKNFGDNVTIYVIDSGFTHNKDFFDNIILEKSFIDDDVSDQIGHGTTVISLISSKYGVSNNVNIVSLKIFNTSYSHDDSYLINALEFTKDHCSNHSRKCIINLSLGFYTIMSDVDLLLEDIYNNNDAIIVSSAGNSNVNSCTRSPAHLDFVITVGSINYFDYKSSFSNYGSCNNLYTYGESVPGINMNGGSILMSGTSMSAPIISGFIANLWSKNQNLNNDEIKQLLYDYYIIRKNGINILYTNENQYDLYWVFLPILISFFVFSFLNCVLCNKLN